MLIRQIKFMNMIVDDEVISGANTDSTVETPDVSVFEAKIEELTSENASLTTTISEMEDAHKTEVTALKSANYDLLKSIPAEGTITDGSTEINLDVVSPSVSDLFEESK